MVLGIAKGTARIRAVSEGVTGYATVEVRQMPTGRLLTYDLLGTESLPIPNTEIGRSRWTDPAGNVHDIFLIVRSGTLRMDIGTGRLEQTITAESYIVKGSHDAPPVETRQVTDEGPILYDFATGLPVLRSAKTGFGLRTETRGASGYVVPQSVLGVPIRRWVWVIAQEVRAGGPARRQATGPLSMSRDRSRLPACRSA